MTQLDTDGEAVARTGTAVDHPFPERVWLIGGSLAIFGLHLALGLGLTEPRSIPDAVGYLTNAEWLAGQSSSVDMGASPFYAFGYSIILVPARLFTGGGTAFYSGVMVTNALLVAAVFPVTYFALRRALSFQPTPALMGAAAAATYPAFSYHSFDAMADAFIPLLMAGFVLTTWLLLTERPVWQRLAFPGVVVALYATHARFTAVLALVGVLYVVLLVRRTVPRRVAVLGFIVLTVGFLAVRVVNAMLLDAHWGSAGSEVTPTEILEVVLSPGTWGEALRLALGQLWYLLAASFGLWLIGVSTLVRRVMAGRSRDDVPAATQAWVCGVLLMAVAAVFATSVAFFVVKAVQPGHLVNGRYNDALAPMLCAVAVAALLTAQPPRMRQRWIALSLVPIAVAGVILAAVRSASDLDITGNWLRIGGIYTHAEHSTFLPIDHLALRVSVVAIVIGVVWALVARIGAVPVGAVIVVTFVLLGLDSRLTTIRDTDRALAVWALPDQVRSTGVDRAVIDPEFCLACSVRLQYLLPDVAFSTGTDSAVNRHTDVAVAPAAWARAETVGARLAFVDGKRDQAVWVTPGPLQEQWASENRLFPPGFPGALTAEAQVSELAADTGEPIEIRPGGSATVDVGLTHAGRGSPWLDDASWSVPGVVRLGARWKGDIGEESRAQLPRTLYAGDRVTIPITITAETSDGTPLAPGRYSIEIGVLQEGFGWFADDGDSTLNLPVRVT